LSFAHLGGFGNGGWRGALRSAQRQAPVRGEGFGERGRRLPAKAGVGSFGVVVRARGGQRDAGMVQGREERLVQQLVPQPAVDGEDGPAPEKGPYAGPTLQKEQSHEPSHRGP